jgi:putative membrane protein
MDLKKLDQLTYAKLFLVIIYLVGILGMVHYRNFFSSLTPFNLIAAAALLFYFHTPKNKTLFQFIAFVGCAGFAIELYGVQTGKLFGNYHYGESLGFKINGTPPIIGLNWVVLTYCTAMMVQSLRMGIYLKSLFAAILMVIFDYFIELYAAHADFWYWQNDQIPLQNFVAWFIFGFFLIFYFSISNSKLKTRLHFFYTPFNYSFLLF